MTASTPEIKRLEATAAALARGPRTPLSERQLAKMRWSIAELRCQREADVARLAQFLFDVYYTTGSMSVRMATGKASQGMRKPPGALSDVEMVWHVKAEAQRLAELATP